MGIYMDFLNNAMFAMATGGVTSSDRTSFNLWNTFDAMRADGESLVGYFAGLCAVLLFGFAVYKIVQAVMSQQGRGANITQAIFALVFGGFLGFNAYNRIVGLSRGAGQTIENWGTGTQNAR